MTPNRQSDGSAMSHNRPTDAQPTTPSRDSGDGGFPPDVVVWLAETYTERGIEIWFDSYRNGDDAHREHMIRMARTDPMGT